MNQKDKQLRGFLNAKVVQYNQPGFIANDPISLPHRFSEPRDIEIIALLVATIAWGQRTSIIRSGERILEYMNHEPYQFVSQFTPHDLKPFEQFVHRTFQPYDIQFFLLRLQHIVRTLGSVEAAFKGHNAAEAIAHFRTVMLATPHEARVAKHIPDIARGAAAKRLNMYLRWMVRKDASGVDFGIWNNLSPAGLFLPLDVHTATVSRKLGLLQRKANDWLAVQEVTSALRRFDPDDPVKYDFALFSLGAEEQF